MNTNKRFPKVLFVKHSAIYSGYKLLIKSNSQLTPLLVLGLVLLPAAASFLAVFASWPASPEDWTWLAGIQDSASVQVAIIGKCSYSWHLVRLYNTVK